MKVSGKRSSPLLSLPMLTLCKGDFSAGIPLPRSRTLEDRETTLQDGDDKEDRECFLRLMRKMLQWEPEKHSSARELAEDEWIVKHTTDS
jgi:serine/threonine-protein kinase SRPK3